MATIVHNGVELASGDLTGVTNTPVYSEDGKTHLYDRVQVIVQVKAADEGK